MGFDVDIFEFEYGFGVDILALKRIGDFLGGKNRRLRLQKRQKTMTQSYKSFRPLFGRQT
jgi:hypothetical protein